MGKLITRIALTGGPCVGKAIWPRIQKKINKQIYYNRT